MKPVALSLSERTPHGIATGIARLITTGELAPGDRLPTVRALAAELGISPATVSHAWQILSAAGLIMSRGRSGSFVRTEPREWLPRRYRNIHVGDDDARLDLSRGTPDPELLPSLGPALERVGARADTPSYQAKPDIPELHDLMRDTWPAPVESITIVNGALDAIDRALGALVRFGDRVVVENPTFPRCSTCSSTTGRNLSASIWIPRACAPPRSHPHSARTPRPSCCSREPTTPPASR